MMRGLLSVPDLESPQDGYVQTFTAAVGRALWKPITGATLSGFAAGLVAFGAAGGTAGTGLTTDPTLSYSGGVLAATSLKASSLTSGRIPFAGTAGLLGDSANLTYSGGTLSNAGGDVAVSGKFLPNNSVSAYLNGSQGAAYGSTGSGSFPFNQSGNLVLESRGGANPRAVVLASAGGSFTAYLDAVGTFNVPSTTASTSSSTGAVVIGNGSSGGLGVGGSVYAGGSINGAATSSFPGIIANGISGAASLDMQPSDSYATSQYMNMLFSPKYNSGGGTTAVAALRMQRTTTVDGNYDGIVSLFARATGGSLTECVRATMPGSANQIGLQVYDQNSATLKQVTVGAADSGGTGFRLLRIPN